MIQPSPIEELIAFIIDNEGEIDINDVLIKAELINMRSKPITILNQFIIIHNGRHNQ